jgi:predicted Zn-dependent protease
LALAALDAEHELEVLKEALSHRPDDKELLGFLLEAAMTNQNLKLALDAGFQLQKLGDPEVSTTLGLLRDLQKQTLSWEVLREVLGSRGQGLSIARVAVLVTENPDSRWVQLIYARTLWDTGEVESAETLLRELLPHFEGGEAHRTLAMLLASARRPADAAPVLLRLTELRPEDMEAQVLLAMAIVDAQEPGLARAQLEQVLEANPLDRGLRYAHAYILMLMGENTEAVDACTIYLEYWPDEGVATWLAGAALRSGLENQARTSLSNLQTMTGNRAYADLAAQL